MLGWRLAVADTVAGREIVAVPLVALVARVADLVGENPDSPSEDPAMVAMFRDLKKLDERDRETIAALMEQMKRRRGKGTS